MSTAKFIYSALPNCQLVKNKQGEECLLLPLNENFIFKNDKGEFSQSLWINDANLNNGTHTGKIRTPKDVNIDHLKIVNGKYLPTLMFLDINSDTPTAAQNGKNKNTTTTTIVTANDDLPY